MKHQSQTQMELLVAYFDRWRQLPKMSKALVCQEIVEAYFKHGYDKILHPEGISFAQTHDIYNDMRVNSQKIGRWLGQDASQQYNHERLFEMEPVIVAAMPENLRISYLSDKYSHSGLIIAISQGKGEAMNPNEMAATLTKEHSEATIAVLKLGDNPDV
ncbi:MAG: hypothetical protein V7677_18590, partial [Motiliproteus sp.]